MDHDRLFKELLTTFFAEFVELFLPDLAQYMERDALEFLDKEVFTDLLAAERHEVDLLVKARSTLISAFMESYLKLSEREKIAYNTELQGIEPAEREAIMRWTNEWIERGKVEGRQAGLVEGRRGLVIRLLRRRLGSGADQLLDRVSQLADAQIDELGEALLDFHDLSDARQWFDAHPLESPTPAR